MPTRRFIGAAGDDAGTAPLREIVERGGLGGVAEIEIARGYGDGDRRLRFKEGELGVEAFGGEIAFADGDRYGRDIGDLTDAEPDRLGQCR